MSLKSLDFSCKFSKLQYNNLAFVAGFKRATDEGSLPEIAQYSPYYLPLNVIIASKGSNLYILFSDIGDTSGRVRLGVLESPHFYTYNCQEVNSIYTNILVRECPLD